ncbi:STAS domain-containing protein [Aquihabitans sp. G128]|uniref:STAS domain-containing protein n=1 Tax=Aquihabitans sp. G128 TaxID=2849779 RepID=UPI001C23C0B4|nr:STAS domain-containing protein [Aquihabitans sp. G128]QXC60877.1 STAS domain-containing protein [Aquihabitans sp. G128]
MEQNPSFTAEFDRDHVHMTVTVSGTFDASDLDAFEAAVGEAGRGRRREWTIDARDLEAADPAFGEALLWIRAEHGHVCLLNPSPAVRAVFEETGADARIVVRSDARGRT